MPYPEKYYDTQEIEDKYFYVKVAGLCIAMAAFFYWMITVI